MHDHGALSQETRETIERWVSDFMERPAASSGAGRIGPAAPDVLASFLEGACHSGHAPADIDAHDVAHALLDHVATLDLSRGAHDAVPSFVASFLGDLEDVGRLAGGRTLANQARAIEAAYRERVLRGVRVERRAAPKIGRNDPCPCGSGKKYKKCCLASLGP